MLKVLAPKYANITSEVVELYKSLCVECAKKRKRAATKGVVVRPILSRDYGSRGQVDLVESMWTLCNQCQVDSAN